jgi:putative transposase
LLDAEFELLARTAVVTWLHTMGARPPSRPSSVAAPHGQSGGSNSRNEINRSCLTSQSAANRTACVLDAVSVGKDHSFHLLGLSAQCKNIARKTQRFQAYRSFGLRHQIPAQDIRCSGIGVVGGARSVAKMDCRLLASDGEADHLHIPVEYPSKLSVSVRVNAFKGTSSRLLRRNRPDIASCYRDGVLWSPAYFAASAGGAPLAMIKQDVEQQR